MEAAREVSGDVGQGEGVLRTQGVCRSYGKRKVVNDVSISVGAGEIVSLLGPNGAGKTTTFYMMVGMIRPDEGRVFLGSTDITNQPMYRRARLGIGFLSQEPSVFRGLTVEQNIMAILETLSLTKSERKLRLEKLLADLDIARLRKSKGNSLSGGERRRTEIARALVTEPALLLLDEPFSGIDPIAVEEIQSILASLREAGLGVLMTDHNATATLALSDRAYIMEEGTILKEGTPDELVNDPEARKAYLGENFRLEQSAN